MKQSYLKRLKSETTFNSGDKLKLIQDTKK